jgi:hypothetical protein
MSDRKALAAIAMYAANGYDLDSASSGTPDAEAAYRVADAIIAAGFARVEKPRFGRPII